jgi:hypothetical protein
MDARMGNSFPVKIRFRPRLSRRRQALCAETQYNRFDAAAQQGFPGQAVCFAAAIMA